MIANYHCTDYYHNVLSQDILGYWDRLVKDEDDPSGWTVESRYCSYGDYCNTTLVEVSNQTVLLELHPDAVRIEYGHYGSQVCHISGWHLVHDQELRELYHALEAYPCIDDEHYINLCWEQYTEWWIENETDVVSEIRDVFKDWLFDEQLDSLENLLTEDWNEYSGIIRQYHELSRESGDYYLDQSSQGIYVPLSLDKLTENQAKEMLETLDPTLMWYEDAIGAYNQDMPLPDSARVYGPDTKVWFCSLGLPGCLPDSSWVCLNKESAIDSLLETIDPNRDLADETVAMIRDDLATYHSSSTPGSYQQLSMVEMDWSDLL